MPSKSSSRVLTDHDEIRRWAEQRGAKPAAVRNTESEDDPGIIRLDFPGYSGAGSLEEIEWDEWFEKFDENGLALIVQENTANGQKSNFNKFVNRESVKEESSSSKSSSLGSRRSGSRSRAKKTAKRKSAQSEHAASSKAVGKKKTSTRRKASRRAA